MFNRKPLLILAFVLALAGVSDGQTATPTPETVTISREAAVKCLETGDKLAAVEAELKSKDQAIADMRALVNDMRVEIAKLTGEKTQLESTLVRYNAVIDLLLKSVRPKKIGLINF